MNFSSFWCNSPLPPDKHHSTGGWYEAWLVDPVPFFLLQNHRPNVRAQILICRAFAEKRSQVMIFLAEKAGAELTIRSQANARAVSAERLRHRGNKPDFARRAVSEPVLAGRFAALVRDLLQGPARVYAPMNLRRGNNQLAVPMTIRVQRHEFDET